MRRINLEAMIYGVMYNDHKCVNCLNPKSLHYMTYDDDEDKWRLTCPSSAFIGGWRTFYGTEYASS